jgi:hypothetical protein
LLGREGGDFTSKLGDFILSSLSVSVGGGSNGLTFVVLLLSVQFGLLGFDINDGVLGLVKEFGSFLSFSFLDLSSSLISVGNRSSFDFLDLFNE